MISLADKTNTKGSGSAASLGRQREVGAAMEVSWRVLKATVAPAVSTAERNPSFSNTLDKEDSVY